MKHMPLHKEDTILACLHDANIAMVDLIIAYDRGDINEVTRLDDIIGKRLEHARELQLGRFQAAIEQGKVSPQASSKDEKIEKCYAPGRQISGGKMMPEVNSTTHEISFSNFNWSQVVAFVKALIAAWESSQSNSSQPNGSTLISVDFKK